MAAVNFEFETKELIELYMYEKGPLATRFPSEVLDQFFILIGFIVEARDERDLRALKGRRMEKLQRGGGEYSLRLNKQFRLIVVRDEDEAGPKLVIKRIEDYH